MAVDWKRRSEMSTDKLIAADELSKKIKMAAEGMKKKPGVMKSTAGYMELVHKYADRIVTAKEKGKWVGVIADVVNLESVPEALSISSSTGTPGEVCSFFRNLDGLMHAGKWPRTDFMDVNLAFSRTPGQPKRYVQEPDVRAGRRLGHVAGRRGQLLLRLRPEEHGGRRRAGAARYREGSRFELGDGQRGPEA
jgi:hypothetical protein